ncbi:hypothetical protein LTR56_000775 [Elasticomyces elasticus]|nr:hypothetical protein LTR22_009069 [Elasticomyces elasticus]KAK3660399.1 hypothetical protein LTR56_000775 [Elasticomyces elasticus]KAK4929210.1 hypothetical protein LTR49_004107 [Elasticomyces elasticus]KAK5765766.1 hypothetical protein LTS12_004026 [Elasticomyces elasticus]
MFLTTLAAIDAAGQLHASSRFRDLELVMCLWINWAVGLEYCGIGGDYELEWRKGIVGFAKKAKLNLVKVGVGKPCRFALNKYNTRVKAFTNKDAGIKTWGWEDAWRYMCNFTDADPYHEEYYFDVTKMSRGKRARLSNDSKDPLSAVPEEHLLDNLLCFR